LPSNTTTPSKPDNTMSSSTCSISASISPPQLSYPQLQLLHPSKPQLDGFDFPSPQRHWIGLGVSKSTSLFWNIKLERSRSQIVWGAQHRDVGSKLHWSYLRMRSRIGSRYVRKNVSISRSMNMSTRRTNLSRGWMLQEQRTTEKQRGQSWRLSSGSESW
jgi:hypothetical protein